jgi:AAA15 family ATPase/GTPase
MIKKISVFNFKVLRGLKNVSLNKITLIGGRNNAGKSSLLEALFLYLDRKNADMFARQVMWRSLINMPLEPSQYWEPFFYNFDLSKKIAIEMDSKELESGRLEITYQNNFVPKVPIPAMNNGVILPTTTQSASRQSFSALSIQHETGVNTDIKMHLIMTSQAISCLIEHDISAQIPIAVFMNSIQILDISNPERLGILDKKNEQAKILPLLRMFEPKLERLILIKSGPNDIIHAVIDDKKATPVHLLGDGFCRCLSIILALATNTDGVLFIDEIENGIHHSLLTEFWSFLIEASNIYNCQIIATTHSYEMIQAFCEAVNEKDFNDASYIRLAKKDDIVSAYSFAFDNLYYALSSKMEVR